MGNHRREHAHEAHEAHEAELHRDDPRRGSHHPRGAETERSELHRAFDRNEDMGGSGWSGASGRGGMGYDERYPSHDHRERHFREPRPPEPGHDYGYPYTHVPGQRWSGGYGGDADMRHATFREPDYAGRGFTGNDFEVFADRRNEGRHFGNAVDRGGRMDSGYRPAAMDDERGPHYGKGPKGYKRSDERIREDVCDAIAHQGHIDASDVEVRVESCIVFLTGTVGQRHHKRLLEQLVESCRGVDEVHNELRLKARDVRESGRTP